MEKKIPVQDLSIFFSVLIATFTLRKKQSKTDKLKIAFADYHSEFKTEIQLVKQRFPELIKISFENIRHPVPAGTHVERKAIHLHFSGATTRLIMFLQYGYLPSVFGKKGGGGHTGKSGSYNNRFSQWQ